MAKVILSRLGKVQLKRLRSDIVLNSIFISDYDNRYGIPAENVCDFFDGFMDYINEEIHQDWGYSDSDLPYDKYWEKHIWDLDNPDKLWEYYMTIDWSYYENSLKHRYGDKGCE
jgi:hypothetical protein